MKKGLGAAAYNFSDDEDGGNNNNFEEEYIDDDFNDNKQAPKKDFWEAPSKTKAPAQKPMTTLQQNNNFNNKQPSALATAGLQSLNSGKVNLPSGIIKDTYKKEVAKDDDDYDNNDYEEDDFDEDEEENFKVTTTILIINLPLENGGGLRETAQPAQDSQRQEERTGG